ncbi:molybdenum cofactor biosynthesis protein B [Chloroflexota bacterium]
MYSVAILTISDKGARGLRQDKSGEVIRHILEKPDCQVTEYAIVPDEIEMIAKKLRRWADRGNIDVVFTTGGTGLAERDVTPEATLTVVDKVVPGLVEAMRFRSLEKTPMAMLSRATAGVRGKCLIVNLPGSPRAVQECLEVILPAVPHAVAIIKGEVTEHETAETGGARS